MPERTFHRRQEWLLRSTPEALWPFVANMHRFNYDSGNPALEPLPGARLPNGYHRLRSSVVEFEEQPFEWVRPRYYSSAKRFRKGGGIFAEVRSRAELLPEQAGGTRLTYELWATPSSALGLLAIPLLLRKIFAGFARVVPCYDQAAALAAPSPLAMPARQVRFVPGGRERLRALAGELRGQRGDPALAGRLVALLEEGDDLELARMRPYALADAWEVPRRAVLELCLWATRLGLLDLEWEVLCPLCRGAKQSAPGLAALNARVHCATCNISFEANFERSVELVFRPNAELRPRYDHAFCVGSPQLTPHIIVQQLLAPGERRRLEVPLEEGRYRLRALELPGGQALVVAAGGAGTASFSASTEGWPNDEPALATQAALELGNGTEREQLLILERMAWSDQAVVAAEVTTLQLFRDLFASEVLRPGEQVTVGRLTIIFTDLRGSTRLYRSVGDAVAFGRVMTHFDTLRQAIAEEGGTIVKTIGDAVMAAFTRPVAAVRAMLRAQQELACPRDGALPLQLKAGIHDGPCIAVNLNDRLDYFGSTVNFAARLEGFAGEGAVILSAPVWRDPEVAALVAALDGRLQIEPFEAAVKGFDDERFPLWRVRHG